MKLLTVTVPCYNSQKYLRRCLDSLLPGDEDVEILIVDDGSTDDTAAIAYEYASRFPDIIRVIHQENSGHGEAINTGILTATGLYFKVVDSDDWVDPLSYAEILRKLRSLCSSGCLLDMLLCNYVYERDDAKHKTVMRYPGQLPMNQLFDWSETEKFKPGKYILMHSVIYRTQILRDCHLVLPKHSFYVDNLYVFLPLPYINIMYYMDVDFYHFSIDRQEQSVSETMLIQNIDQELFINKIMIDAFDLRKIPNPNLRRYMISYLEFVTVISTMMLVKSGTKENLEKERALWAYLKEKDPWLFHSLRRHIRGRVVYLPGRRGHRTTLSRYKTSQKVISFD